MSDHEVREWIEVASHDIDTVHILVREKGHPDIIIYHIHQTVEKLIKAILIRKNVSFEKSHRLDKLFSKAVSYYPDLMNIKDEILEIDYYMPKLRYPSGERIDFETALRIYEIYKNIEKLLWSYTGGV